MTGEGKCPLDHHHRYYYYFKDSHRGIQTLSHALGEEFICCPWITMLFSSCLPY